MVILGKGHSEDRMDAVLPTPLSDPGASHLSLSPTAEGQEGTLQQHSTIPGTAPSALSSLCKPLCAVLAWRHPHIDHLQPPPFPVIDPQTLSTTQGPPSKPQPPINSTVQTFALYSLGTQLQHPSSILN